MAEPLLWPGLLWPALLGLLGAIFGSFIAALVIRWPEGRSVLRGRSHCDACGRTLGPAELVPLLSWAMQRGRCRGCGAAIDWRHVAIEALAVGIGVAAGIAAPGGAGIAGAIFGWLLLALAALDVVALWLPDRLTVLLALTGLATGMGGLAPDLTDRLIGGVAGFGVLWAIGWAYERVRGRQGLGGGDPKLLGAIGLWVGWRMLPAVVLLACLVGLAAVALVALRGGRVARTTAVPFGALLAVAAYAAWIAMIRLVP